MKKDIYLRFFSSEIKDIIKLIKDDKNTAVITYINLIFYTLH